MTHPERLVLDRTALPDAAAEQAVRRAAERTYHELRSAFDIRRSSTNTAACRTDKIPHPPPDAVRAL